MKPDLPNYGESNTIADTHPASWSLLGTFFVFLVVFTMDRIGRRTLFCELTSSFSSAPLHPTDSGTVIAFPSLAACLFAEGLLQWKYLGTTDKAGNSACVFVLFMYIICYQAVDAPSFVWSAEVFPTTIRAKGLGLTLFAYFVGAITYTTPSALAFKNMSASLIPLPFLSRSRACTIKRGKRMS